MHLREATLEQLEELLLGEYLSIPNVCFFMQSIRVLLEIDKSKNKYKVTWHYCNWLLHKELDRSNSPLIIQEIADSFKEFSTKNDLIKKINSAISLKTLVIELKEILWLNIPNKKVVCQMDFEANWINFIKIILQQILFRPVKLREQDLLVDKFKFSIYGIQVIYDKEKYNIELLSKELEIKQKRIIVEIALFKD